MYAVQTVYTIKEAAARSGLSVPVLRAWERRYGIVAPVRTASGYRLYDEDALGRLRSMRGLIAAGWSPSSAAAALLDGSAPELPDPSAGPGAGGADEPSAEAQVDLRNAFIAAAADLDAAGVEQVLDEMFAGGTFEQVAERHVLPALEDLGEAWAAGRLDVAAEHAASHAVQRRLAAAYQAAGRPGEADGAILVGLPSGARHELGALAFAIAGRRAGLPILYLGPDLPVADWVATARRTRARAAIVGAVTRADGAAALEVARALAGARPGIVVGFGGAGAPDPTAGRWTGPRPIRLPDGIRAAVEALTSALAAAPA